MAQRNLSSGPGSNDRSGSLRRASSSNSGRSQQGLAEGMRRDRKIRSSNSGDRSNGSGRMSARNQRGDRRKRFDDDYDE